MEKHDTKENAIKMFENLKKHIDERIICKYWWYGSEQNNTDILKKVNYFSHIETECNGIPFIGYGAAISTIQLEETGEVLYFNPYIEDEYDRRYSEDIEDVKREFYGDEVTKKQRDRRIEAEEIYKKEMEDAALEAKKTKYSLMREGLTLIKPETVEDWLKFVDNNSNDGYSVYVVKATISMMKKFEEGISFEEAEKQVYNEEFELSGFLAGATASALAHFSKQGEEYRKYWNKQYGVDDPEEKGTVNPAILTLR